MTGERELDLIDAMVAIIRSPSIDTETARAAATVISVDANFNARVASRKKQEVERSTMHDLIDFAEEILGEARAIASAVEEGFDSHEAGTRLRALRKKIANYSI
ncbi:hypothetical protein [Neorhizobium sp. P12A]|uniref:hypothetical protein n=1 Tax=Neorhizobium sp. P12A TaxID=2268027 RepID=UPI0011EFACEF|nr:hypothetical protein [Neorhizobium sp. P12A]